MTRPSDDELGDLLTETFAAHEDLADPDRAVAIATSPGRSRNTGRTLMAAAAAVALVVGTSYVVSRGSDAAPVAGPDHPSPPTAHQPPLPTLRTDAQNRALATAAATRVAASLPAYPGAAETDAAGVPELADQTLSTVHPQGHTIGRSRFWTVDGVTPRAVAEWYDAHPVAGLESEGGVGGEGDGTTWIDEVYWDPPTTSSPSQPATSVEIETTRASSGVGVRVTVSSVWPPARPLQSFVQDVSSIDVRSVHDHYGRQQTTTHRSFTVSAPNEVLAAAVAYDALPGMTPMALPCPMQMDVFTDRIVFHTATGDVTATSHSSACGYGMSVRRDGHLVDPQLGDADRLLRSLGLVH